MARYKRIKKKGSLKTPDEFLSFWSRTYNWLTENRDRLLAPLLIVLLVIVMAGGLFFYRQQKGLTAQREFSNIMKIYPRGTESTPAELEEAARSLADFSERFSGTGAVRVAELYRAHSLARQAKTVEAEKVYGEILDSSGGDELVKEMAALSLARLYQDQGKYEESSGVLKKITKEKEPAFLEELDFITAQNLDLGKNKAAALEEYRKFLTKHPASPRVPEVSEKIANLLTN